MLSERCLLLASESGLQNAPNVGVVLHRGTATELAHQPADDQVALGFQVHLVEAHVLLRHAPALQIGGEPQANVGPGAARAVEAHRVAPFALNRAWVHAGPREGLQCGLRHVPATSLVAVRFTPLKHLDLKGSGLPLSGQNRGERQSCRTRAADSNPHRLGHRDARVFVSLIRSLSLLRNSARPAQAPWSGGCRLAALRRHALRLDCRGVEQTCFNTGLRVFVVVDR